MLPSLDLAHLILILIELYIVLIFGFLVIFFRVI